MARTIPSLIMLATKIVCAVTIFFSSVLTIYTIGPSIETRYFPVVSKLSILAIEARVDDTTAIAAGFTKLRDCEYIGIAWFHGGREQGFERVPITLLRQPGDVGSPTRPLGYQTAGPWLINLPVDEVRGNSFAELRHRCHPLWVSVTRFYP